MQQVILSNNQLVTLVPTSDMAWTLFLQAVAGDDSTIFHWSHYDVTYLRKTAPVEVINALQNRFCDLHRIFKHSVKFPIDDNSLKTVAHYLGFTWAKYEHYFEAFVDYRNWLRTGDIKLLTSACAYQNDVMALDKVWTWLVNNVSYDTSSQ